MIKRNQSFYTANNILVILICESTSNISIYNSLIVADIYLCMS